MKYFWIIFLGITIFFFSNQNVRALTISLDNLTIIYQSETLDVCPKKKKVKSKKKKHKKPASSGEGVGFGNYGR